MLEPMIRLWVLSGVVAAAGCTPGERSPAPEGATPAAVAPVSDLVGEVSREQILTSFPRWQRVFEHAEVSPNVQKLTGLPAGGHVDIILGTWCGDSVQELTHFWKSLDALGGPPPFSVRYLAVDRKKQSSVSLPVEVAYVPTFVVSRGETRVGQIVESAPEELIGDLAALLSGEKTGVLTGRVEVEPTPVADGQGAPPSAH